MDVFTAPFECKFADKGAAGEFEGYGSVFDNEDSHGDKIAQGAFAETIAERKAQGRGNPPMSIMHSRASIFGGGDTTPPGVWKFVGEDSKGLLVKGKISGAENTERGKHLVELVKDGALKGLSIEWTQRKDGTVMGAKSTEPKRLLKSVNLHGISLVDDPSNPMATVMGIKSTQTAGLFDDLVRAGMSRGLTEHKARAAADDFLRKIDDGHEDPTSGLDPETKAALAGLETFALPMF